MTAAPSSENTGPNGGDGGLEPNETPQRQKLDRGEAIDLFCENADTLIRRLAPTLIEGVEHVHGAEPATLTLTGKFNPGGSSSAARFDVAAKLAIPGGGFSHSVAFSEREDGSSQLSLFAPED